MEEYLSLLYEGQADKINNQTVKKDREDILNWL